LNPGVDSLGPKDVHLWRAHLHELAPLAGQLRSTLSPDERDRAERYRLSKDGEAFTIRRGLLRAILSRYLHSDAGEIRFKYGPFGKPSLDPDKDALSFNLAHSQDLILCAVSRRALGVDIEFLRPLPDLDGLAARFFVRPDADRVRALPMPRRLAAFYTCWTRQEAYLKATGDGLSAAPATIDAGLHAAGWKLETLLTVPDYVGALAAEGVDWCVSWLDWPLNGSARG